MIIITSLYIARGNIHRDVGIYRELKEYTRERGNIQGTVGKLGGRK